MRCHATAFVLRLGRAFERCCGCGAHLAGSRGWFWAELDRKRRVMVPQAACLVCLPLGAKPERHAA